MKGDVLMYAVEMQDLTKQYGSKTVVDGLNLKIEEGEFFAMSQGGKCCQGND